MRDRFGVELREEIVYLGDDSIERDGTMNLNDEPRTTMYVHITD